MNKLTKTLRPYRRWRFLAVTLTAVFAVALVLVFGHGSAEQVLAITPTLPPTATPTPTPPPHTKTPCPDGKIVKGEQPNSFCGTPTPVGGLAVDLDADAPTTPLDTAQSSVSNAGLRAGVVAAVVAGVIALGGGAWYARRRWLR